KGIGIIQNEEQNEHASFLQPAINKLLTEQQILLKNIDAVAVVNGPGSYTGLRVGLASAKGICFALNKPLITIGSLPLMAKAAIKSYERDNNSIPLLCPMIDARRMEVFTAIYNSSLTEIFPAQALILNHDSFVATLLQNKVLFFGNGAFKFKTLTNHSNALFSGIYNSYEALCEAAYLKFTQKEFTDLAYSEPLYLKEFYSA
ncbi:MAG TPA: tRNA (adenosine(37)-N6)-threonylcarbamoyltransferase complex dimerization subunit type 1 TsaB, partial [Ferruginibacter sp.]|nr:tRNA (adenosine(37)-N6)-threonylcarbamoyltransferase complex dimerization subunit type 1 TsaB [Ferruginibacter sp.]